MKKNQNGVTLIALAVTIIVMLILAGVTMATLTGDTGIITQSRRTAAASTEGTLKENMSAAFTSVSMEVQTERAVSAAIENADVNHLDKEKYCFIKGNIIDDIQTKDAVGYEKYDVVVANILADVIVPLSAHISTSNVTPIPPLKSWNLC